MERIDSNTWMTEDGNEIKSKGLTITVEFGEKTKREILAEIEKVKSTNANLISLCRKALYVMEDNCALCAYNGKCSILADCKCVAPKYFREEMKSIGIEV